MTEKSTHIRVNIETLEKLRSLKKSDDTYSTIINRLIDDNEKLTKILCNVEYLQEHLQQKEII